MNKTYIYCHYLGKNNKIKTVEMLASKGNYDKDYSCFYGARGYRRINEADLNKVFKNTFEGCVGVFTKDKNPYNAICLIIGYIEKEKTEEIRKMDEKIEEYSKLIKSLHKSSEKHKEKLNIEDDYEEER